MNYFLALFWMMFTSIVGHTAGMYHRERVLGKEERRATWTYALFVMVPIILIAGMRTIYFGDTTMYVRSFQSIPSSLRGKWEYAMVTYTKDHGFYLLGAFISLFVGVHARYYLLILAAIHGLILAKVYRRFSDDYWFSVFVFIASTDIYSWMYNGLRQFTAVTITLLAAEPIMKKRYIKACLIIVVCLLLSSVCASDVSRGFHCAGKTVELENPSGDCGNGWHYGVFRRIYRCAGYCAAGYTVSQCGQRLDAMAGRWHEPAACSGVFCADDSFSVLQKEDYQIGRSCDSGCL